MTSFNGPAPRIPALPSAKQCGNHLDRFPCKTCGAHVPIACPRYSIDYAKKAQP